MLKKLGVPVSAALTVESGSHGNDSYYYLLQSRAGNQQLYQEMTVSKMSETVRVQSGFRHAIDHLRKLGVPANSSVQVELDSAEGKTLTLQSQFGGDQAGLSLKMKYSPTNKEMRGTLWHSWSWLQDRGVPYMTEGLCSVQGFPSQLQSKALLSVDRHQLLVSSLNVTVSEWRLPRSSPTHHRAHPSQAHHRLDTALSASVQRLKAIYRNQQNPPGANTSERDSGGKKSLNSRNLEQNQTEEDGRVTGGERVKKRVKERKEGRSVGRLTESQLKCSMAVNPELSSSLALIVQGTSPPDSKDLMVKVVQNIPRMLTYLPSQLNVHSQLNQTQSSVSGLAEVLSGRRRLLALGELAVIESGYRQALELKHSYPQFKPFPRTVALRTVYEARNWSYQVQHGAVWGNQEVNVNALFSSPPALEMGNQSLQVQISSVPRWTSLDVTLERSLQGRLDRILLDWTRHGRLEQVSAVSLWRQSEDMNETRVELKQPFSSTLSHMSLHTISSSSQRQQSTNHQTHLSWDSAVPVNVSLTLNKQWQENTSRGQACALFSSPQTVVSSVKGCMSVVQEGNSYSQHAELRWDNRSIKQGMKYQKGLRGMHSLQVNVWLDKVSPAPCPSHTVLAKIQTNLRDRLEHTVQLGLCPPQPVSPLTSV
ncbi:uncharacterized protein LOC115437390 [Sphaeramia orbicularis]|uniref:uncharacterized protein LOC115437390 n=1 Tax=Sphaeramia orbicularis TaxID=375764 RepID=UPI00117EED58|nr:uncharacterized protein LOC115437390 [Sphaeramia orbicularis]